MKPPAPRLPEPGPRRGFFHARKLPETLELCYVRPMPRSKRDPDDLDALTQYVGGMVSMRDLQMIQRVMRRYGMGKSNAVRLLIRAGAEHHDPSPPSKDTQ